MDPRQHSPAVARNREPIGQVLDAVLPSSGLVLEVAAGTGEHGVFFAQRFPQLTWQPTDVDLVALQSIRAWQAEAGLENLRPPVRLDVTEAAWPVEEAAAIFNANMIHISPWETTLGLLDGASRLLAEGAPLVMYGPYRIGGVHTAPSNARFEEWLKQRDPRNAVRNLETVAAEAEQRGLELVHRVQMPANNQTLVFRRRADGA